MTKILVWGSLIILIVLSVHFNDKFSKNCKEAGGIPTMTFTDMVCLHPSSIIELKREIP